MVRVAGEDGQVRGPGRVDDDDVERQRRRLGRDRAGADGAAPWCDVDLAGPDRCRPRPDVGDARTRVEQPAGGDQHEHRCQGRRGGQARDRAAGAEADRHGRADRGPAGPCPIAARRCGQDGRGAVEHEGRPCRARSNRQAAGEHPDRRAGRWRTAVRVREPAVPSGPGASRVAATVCWWSRPGALRLTDHRPSGGGQPNAAAVASRSVIVSRASGTEPASRRHCRITWSTVSARASRSGPTGRNVTARGRSGPCSAVRCRAARDRPMSPTHSPRSPARRARARHVGQFVVGPTRDRDRAVAQRPQPRVPSQVLRPTAASAATTSSRGMTTVRTSSDVATGTGPCNSRHASRHAVSKVSTSTPYRAAGRPGRAARPSRTAPRTAPSRRRRHPRRRRSSPPSGATSDGPSTRR